MKTIILIILCLSACVVMNSCGSEQIYAETATAQTTVVSRVEDDAPEYSCSGTVFTYNGRAFDLAEAVPSVNALYQPIPVGDKLVITGHINPHNGMYFIFDTVSEEIVKQFDGLNLIWQGDDITTAVYTKFDRVMNYHGETLRIYDLELYFEQIMGLSFSEDNSTVTVTISNGDAEDTIDVIDLDSIERYALTVNDAAGLLLESPKSEYLPGETVVLRTDMVYDISIVCEVNGESIGERSEIIGADGHIYLEFRFEMPESDADVSLALYDYNTNILG